MALPFAKITIIVGAGILGSVLAKEGGPNISDLVSGGFKIFWKQLKRDDSPASSGKPRNDSTLIAQVKELQKQLKDLIDNRPITIITPRSGAKTYGIPVFGIVVVGVGCMWWKGWKISDMMFATRRGLTDACSSVAKQLDQVSSSISGAKRHLSSRIDRVDINLDECAELTANTRYEVTELRGDLRVFSGDVESVHRAVQTLESKIGKIEQKQDYTTQGVLHLCDFVQTIENSRATASIQASPSSFSRPALEHAPTAPVLRSSSLSLESPSPTSTNESPKALRPLESSGSASGLKVLEELSVADVTWIADGPKSNSSRFGWKFASPTFLSRTQSATAIPPFK